MMWRPFALVLAAATVAAATSTLNRVTVLPPPAIGVRLELSDPVVPVVRTLAAADGLPDRVYLDLPATARGRAAAVTTGGPPLLRVRTGQFDSTTTRVVLDLASPSAYVVRREGASLVVELDAPAHVALSPPDARHRRLVVVDAGHGGHDPGATGIGGVLEKTLTLDLARAVAARLESRLPVDVVLTRERDTFVAIDDRIALAPDAALFLSLHANAAVDPHLHGIEVFFGGGGPMPAAAEPQPPLRLGRAVIDAVERRLGDVHVAVRPGTYGVLARNTAPSVLIEVGYITNADDAARLRTTAYRESLVDAVVDAVGTFLREQVPS